MTSSGDAAEQIVRMSLEGVEVAAKITGAAAKEIATLLFAALKSKNSCLKLKGKARLTSMLKSGKALEIYSVKERDLQQFVQGAKEYGIVYCVLRNTKNNPDGLCDIMVKADDAPKISRLSERFKFATVDKAKIESEIVKAMDGRRLMMNEITGEKKVMDVISVKEEYSKQLINEFKKNGVDYRDLKDSKSDKNGIADIMVQSKDREKVDDILAKLNIENLAPQSKDGEISALDINDTEKLLDKLMGERGSRETEFRGERRSGGVSELSRRNAEAWDTQSATTKGKAAPEPTQAEQNKAGKEAQDRSPLAVGGPPKINPSAPTSESRSNSAKGTFSKPSVKEEIREIKAAQKAKDADTPVRDDKAVSEKPKNAPATTTHKQPQGGKKSKKSKER